MTKPVQSKYVLGHSTVEHERLARQARLLDGCTERLLRAAGIVPGMKVLDVGCGIGDVSLLAARLVGPEGQVVGTDQDPSAVSTARQRVARVGDHQVRFEQVAL